MSDGVRRRPTWRPAGRANPRSVKVPPHRSDGRIDDPRVVFDGVAFVWIAVSAHG